MPIKLNTASGGGVILQGANTASDKTITVPAVDATMLTDSSGVLNIGSGQVYKDASGNVGIGTSSPTSRLHVHTAGSSYSIVQITNGDTGSTVNDGLHIGMDNNGTTAAFNIRDASGVLVFRTQDAERARIAANGDFTIASTTLFITNIPTTSTAGNCLISSGEGNKFYRSTSSLKYKRNVVDMQRGISDVKQLRPVNFNGVSDFDGDKLFAGFIAEEVEALNFKEFVIYDENGEPDGLQYANMVALLTKAIQEQQQMIETLQAKVAALEAK